MDDTAVQDADERGSDHVAAADVGRVRVCSDEIEERELHTDGACHLSWFLEKLDKGMASARSVSATSIAEVEGAWIFEDELLASLEIRFAHERLALLFPNERRNDPLLRRYKLTVGHEAEAPEATPEATAVPVS